jgi:uncharacterized protein
MVGRLARYLRFLGHDTEYVRGLSDHEIARRARDEQRCLLTRDRELAAQLDGAILLRSVDLADQLRQVRAESPAARFEVTFDRCTLCNAPLAPWTALPGSPWPPEIPDAVRGSRRPIFRCTGCDHAYWEGSHTEHVRRTVAEWLRP